MKIWDISPLISEKTAVFPGDVPYSREVSMAFPTDHLTLSSIRSTLHIGAHADAGVHYHSNGKGIDQRELERFLGNCQVISVKIPRGERILPSHVTAKIDAPRVLFHTDSFPNPEEWNGDFNSLSPELIHFLHDKGVITVGIDTPSVDPATSKALESHQALHETGMAVLEGIILNQVKDGIYTLVALPLPLQGADASPVRAILLEKNLLN